MFKIIRKFLWRILGFDYHMILDKTDFTLLKNDRYSRVGIKTYDNGAKVWRWSNAPLIIGNYCSIANNVNFIVDEGFHTISGITNFPLAKILFKKENSINGLSKEDFFNKHIQKEGIVIGNDVWIGMGAYIMPGVKIGNGVTIAANAVVTKNISDYTVVAGSPAKVIKAKFDSETIFKLNKISWWNWEESIIKERINYFYNDIEGFINKFSK